ncbi:MAG: TonB-dependent receptor [Bacteroidota bacterium]
MRSTVLALVVLIIVAGSVTATESVGQNLVLKKEITLNVQNLAIEDILTKIEKQADIIFVYSKSKITLDQKVNKQYASQPLKKVLDDLLPDDVTYGSVKNKIILKKSTRKTARPNSKETELGAVEGTITDANNNILPFASVMIKGLDKGTITGADGRFSMRLPEGSFILLVQYLGYNDQEVMVNIVGGQTTLMDVALVENVSELEGVTVYGILTRGQAKALNNQKSALNIKNVVDNEQFLRYPDVSAAETVQRLPGVSITRDQGEGEFVQIRGVSEQFNALTINGQRMPSIEPDAGRAVGLDLVQSYLIQTITVTKALTPDLDADALGGMVDFKLREASNEPELELYAGYGFNQQESEIRTFGRDIVSFSGVASKRFANGKFGALISGSYFNTDRGSVFNSQRFENIAENILSRRRTTDYDVNRERYGLVGNFDFKLSPKHKWILTTNYNSYVDDEIRRQAIFNLPGREERRTRNRVEDQQLQFYQLLGEHKVGRVEFDYFGSYAKGSEDLPDRTEWRFRDDNPFLDNLTREEQANLNTQSAFDLDEPLGFNSLRFDPRFTEETNSTGGFNMNFPLKLEGKSTMKFGVKYRELNRDFREADLRPGFVDESQEPSVQSGQFGFADVHFNQALVEQLNLDESSSDVDFINSGQSYQASEGVFAGYIMNTTNWTGKFSSLAGVRVERTSTDYTLVQDQTEGGRVYTNFLPSVHLTYRFNNKSQLRAAYSSGLSRPNYTDLVPASRFGDDSDFEGNPDLRPVTAQSYDLMFEHYSNRLGVFTFGVFAKDLNNFIVREQIGTNPDTGLPIESLTNGGEGSVFGFETSINQSLSILKMPMLKWISVNANYTFTDTQADFGDDRDALPLANSPRHIGNLSLLYDNPKIGLSAVIGGVYRHFIFNKFEDADGDDINENIWLDQTFHLDFSVAYKINDQFSLRLQMNNLTNESNTEVNGRPSDQFSRIHETESYGFWGLLGIEFHL